jgi:hypothetical protein
MATIRRRGKKFQAMVRKGQHSQSKAFSSKDSDNGQTDSRAGNLVYAKWPVKSELPLHDHFHAPLTQSITSSRAQSSGNPREKEAAQFGLIAGHQPYGL